MKQLLLTLCCALLFLDSPVYSATVISDPEVDHYNVRIGTQAFNSLYHFSTNHLLVEEAQAIQELGSDILKFHMGRDHRVQYHVALPPSATNLTALAHFEPYQQVFAMPFRHYIIWAYTFTGDHWKNGFSGDDKTNEYKEIYDFTRHLLTEYNHTGKSFYLGHWEGDWTLLGNYDPKQNPSPTAVQGMRDWLNTRQQAVDDAKRDTPHSNVEVWHYTEVNRVRDAMVPQATNYVRVINAVVPCVTNLDYVSWSSYDGLDLNAKELTATLNYIESMLPTNKAQVITGKRVFVGEYGFGVPTEKQETLSRTCMKQFIDWGCPFVLFWQLYNNEPGRYFCLIDSAGKKTPAYNLHERFIKKARLSITEFKKSKGRLPDAKEFELLVSPTLDQPF